MLPPARQPTAAPAPSTSFTTLAYDVYTLGARLLHKQEQHHHNKAMVTAVFSLGSLVLMTAVSVQFSFVIYNLNLYGTCSSTSLLLCRSHHISHFNQYCYYKIDHIV